MTKSDLSTLYQDTGLTSNMEDYMETIAVLSESNKVVRVKDIAGSLDIKMPSVTAALNKLKEMGLIEYEKYGYIELTVEGRAIADSVCKRHTCLTEFFEKILFLKSDDAGSEACRAEHTLTPQTCVQIHKFLDFFSSEQSNNEEWITRLKNKLG